MKTVFDDVRRIWRLTTTERGASTMVLLNGLALTAGGLLSIFAGAALLAQRGNVLLLLRVLGGGGGFWLALVWALLFMPASMEMNTPANARLVPRQRRRLMQMAVAGWLLASVGLAVGYGAWGAFPAAGFALMGVPMLRGGRYGGIFLLMFGPWPTLARLLPASVAEAVDSPAGIVLASALLLPVGAWVLRLAYPAGGDAHLDGRASLWFGIGAADNPSGVPVSTSAWSARFAYSAALRRDCRAPRPQAMLMHALGPTAHWSAWSTILFLMLILGIAVWLTQLMMHGRDGMGGFIDWLLGFGMTTTAIMVLFTTSQFPQQLRRTRAEQALLRLTPLAGDPARLNRRLALGLLRSALTIWALVTGTILLAGWLLGAGGFDLLCQLAMCCLAGQLAMTRLLGDFASEVASPDGVRLFLFVLQGLVNAGLALLLAKPAGGFWIALALLGAGGGVLALVLGWRRMLAAAPAYPALRAG